MWLQLPEREAKEPHKQTVSQEDVLPASAPIPRFWKGYGDHCGVRAAMLKVQISHEDEMAPEEAEKRPETNLRPS